MAKLHIEDPRFKAGQLHDTFLPIVQGTTHPPTKCVPGFFVWGGGERGLIVRLIHLYLRPMVRINGVIPLRPLYAFMVWMGKNFTLFR